MPGHRRIHTKRRFHRWKNTNTNTNTGEKYKTFDNQLFRYIWQATCSDTLTFNLNVKVSILRYFLERKINLLVFATKTNKMHLLTSWTCQYTERLNWIVILGIVVLIGKYGSNILCFVSWHSEHTWYILMKPTHPKLISLFAFPPERRTLQPLSSASSSEWPASSSSSSSSPWSSSPSPRAGSSTSSPRRKRRRRMSGGRAEGMLCVVAGACGRLWSGAGLLWPCLWEDSRSTFKRGTIYKSYKLDLHKGPAAQVI